MLTYRQWAVFPSAAPIPIELENLHAHQNDIQSLKINKVFNLSFFLATQFLVDLLTNPWIRSYKDKTRKKLWLYIFCSISKYVKNGYNLIGFIYIKQNRGNLCTEVQIFGEKKNFPSSNQHIQEKRANFIITIVKSIFHPFNPNFFLFLLLSTL